MAKDDYLPPTTGGTLRLKGAKDAGITKKKNKKKKAKAPVSPSAAQRASSASLGAGTGDEAATSARGAEDRVGDRILEGAATAKERGVNPLQEGGGEREGEGEGEESAQVYKTEAERRHEEMRRKRVRFHSLMPTTIYLPIFSSMVFFTAGLASWWAYIHTYIPTASKDFADL